MVLTRAIASGGGSASTCSAVPRGSSAFGSGVASGTIIAYGRGSITHRIEMKRRDLFGSSPVRKIEKIKKIEKNKEKRVQWQEYERYMY